MRRQKHKCPVCHDPHPFIMWIDEDGPTECPYGADIVTNCSYQMNKARGEADRRKFCPEAFDQNGKIKPNGWALISEKMKELSPRKVTI